MAILLADSGATKCEWCLAETKKRTQTVFTQGISPYFLDTTQIETILRTELLPNFKKTPVIDAVYYYGTGCSNPGNIKIVKKAIAKVFPGTQIEVTDDVTGAARALCKDEKGMACILGTGSSACYYNGKKIVKNSPGLGYVLGDEGSGTWLGRKVLQYYLYNTFDEELRYKFDAKYATTRAEILENVYKKPLPNRYLASYTLFLAENRGHYMVENIIEDGLNDFFFTHLCKYTESWKLPIHFVGGVSFAFSDIITDLCQSYEFEQGIILKNPMEGLIQYHVH
jgi:N-acetylglucosamine kinase-like BadF-type ATPase